MRRSSKAVAPGALASFPLSRCLSISVVLLHNYEVPLVRRAIFYLCPYRFSCLGSALVLLLSPSIFVLSHGPVSVVQRVCEPRFWGSLNARAWAGTIEPASPIRKKAAPKSHLRFHAWLRNQSTPSAGTLPAWSNSNDLVWLRAAIITTCTVSATEESQKCPAALLFWFADRALWLADH
jgi:hypothetical protein